MYFFFESSDIGFGSSRSRVFAVFFLVMTDFLVLDFFLMTDFLVVTDFFHEFDFFDSIMFLYELFHVVFPVDDE